MDPPGKDRKIMATPFDRPQTNVKLATVNQLTRAIGPMLEDRDWHTAAPAWASRCAAIKTTLHFAQTAADPSVQAQLDIVLSDPADVATSFAELMDHLYAAAVNDERDPSLFKPLTAEGASKLIDWLGSRQWAGSSSVVEEANVAKATAAAEAARASRNTNGFPSAEEVPAGRYAIDTLEGAANELAFYKVDRPTTGRWAGYVFVNRMVGGNPDVPVKGQAAKNILARIAEDAKGAAIRYGHEIGECGRCGIELTNDESRAYGIGPDCRKKLGW